MKTRLCLIARLAVGLLAIAFAQTGQADDPPAVDGSRVETKKLNEFIEQSIDWYEILPSADSKTPLRPQPVLRWRNAARGQAGEAMMVIWCQHGRPEIMASIYPWEGMLHHEFGSLSRAAKLVARKPRS